MKSPAFLSLCLTLCLAASHLYAQAPAPAPATPAQAGNSAAPQAQVVPYLTLPMSDEGLPGTGPIRRGDWFIPIWNGRRAAFIADIQKDQGAVVFLGDSITQGWSDLPGLFPGLKVANRGISGDTTRGVLMRLQDDVIRLNPRAVVLLIGTNDLDDNATLDTINGNVRLILTALKAHNPAMPVVLCAVLPSSPNRHRPTWAISKLNSLYLATAEDFPQVTVVDTYAALANSVGEAVVEEMPDLLHPNGLGYAKFAAALRPTLETLGLVPSWPDDFTPEAGFVSLFNGRDLSGWEYAGEKSLAGALATSDGRFLARNGRLVVAASKKERDYRQFWTTRQFPKDFVLRLQFRASPNADSGVYVRGEQVQCRDYRVAGPFNNLRSYRSCDWNDLEITVRGGLAHVTCNGEVIIDAMPVPADGKIGVESDRGQMEYRRIRVLGAE